MDPHVETVMGEPHTEFDFYPEERMMVISTTTTLHHIIHFDQAGPAGGENPAPVADEPAPVMPAPAPLLPDYVDPMILGQPLDWWDFPLESLEHSEGPVANAPVFQPIEEEEDPMEEDPSEEVSSYHPLSHDTAEEVPPAREPSVHSSVGESFVGRRIRRTARQCRGGCQARSRHAGSDTEESAGGSTRASCTRSRWLPCHLGSRCGRVRR